MDKKRTSMGKYSLLDWKNATQDGKLIDRFSDNKDRSFTGKQGSRIGNESRRVEAK